ncbi:META domain-containing protein [Arthrobacter sp.]|uniref:META domain-containing protein n=1 Tax=Arthrobacter sp. TaxID=1667 RepID=UPI0026E04E5C|nr:META domain-containing protein [Arthrobacter sp.]MDO5754268.1 META domain-containing protein [Arthrobacter sp.]
MKKYFVLLGATMALLLASACSTTPAGTPAADTPSATVSDDTDLANPTEADCTPVAGGIPATEQDFSCLNLSSASGSDATGELAWVGSDPFTLVTMARDGALSFSSKTPCNTLMSTVKVTDKQFIVDPNMAMTMMACQSPQSDYEKWVSTFFSAPLDYTLNKDSLVLRGEHGTVTFKPAAA